MDSSESEGFPIVEELVPYGTLQLMRTVSALGLIVIREIGRIPVARRFFTSLLTDTIPLEDVPADVDEAEVERKEREFAPPPAINFTLIFLTAFELLAWTIVFGYQLSMVFNDAENGNIKRSTKFAAGMLLVWVRLLLDLSLRRPKTIPWGALWTYITLFLISVVTLLVAGYFRMVYGAFPEWATSAELILESINAVVTLILALAAGGLRFYTPLTLARAGDPSMDDVVTYWQWMTFSWMSPFIAHASKTELEPEDLPVLSRTLQSRIVFDKFKAIKASKLLWRLAKANRLDIFVDIGLTIVSVFFNYLGPRFLQLILISVKTISDTTKPEVERKSALAMAYLLALGALLTSVLKAVSDLIHLWHGRRGYVRINTELIAAIYDKSLRRKDVSGVITKQEEETNDDKKSDKKDGKDVDKEPKKSNADTGKVVNMMSGDARSIASTISFMYQIVSSPVEIIIASAFLYSLLGWSAFTGIIVLVLVTPLNSWVSSRAMKIHKQTLKARDKRISVMNELISAITFIKFFAWTDRWKKRAEDARANELKQEVRGIINGLAFTLLWSLVPILVTLCAFFSYVIIAGRELTVDVGFTAIALFSLLRMPLNAIPMFWVWILQAFVSIGRLDDFFAEEDVPDWVSSLKREDTHPTGPTKIGFERATLRWNSGEEEKRETGTERTQNGTPVVEGADAADASSTAVSTQEAFELADINVNFPIGHLTVITGPTGAGKTAMLIGLLGEMELVEGQTFLPKYPTDVDPATGLRNSVAYAAQTPWLQQQSIKENILFGEQLDEQRYEAVVDACALRTDFDILEDGDETEIGAKGVSLSGGQKARVALARAVYSYTQHVLLDDPLAAVDSHTAKHLVDECLNGPVLKGRTVILVSHHLDLLVPSAHHIVRILDGRIDCQGSCKELQASGQLEGIVAIEEATAIKHEPVAADDVEENAEEQIQEDVGNNVKKKRPARKLIQDEERAVGNVKLSTYLFYLKSATIITWFLWLLTLVLSQGTTVGERLWLIFWNKAYDIKVNAVLGFFRFLGVTPDAHHFDSSDYYHSFVYHVPELPTNDTTSDLGGLVVQGAVGIEGILPQPPALTHPGYYLAGYTIIVMSTAVVTVLSSMVGSWGNYRAAKKIHNELLNSVLGGTIRFFNTTPLGRILNRFSKDIETIDGNLGFQIRTTGAMIAALVSSVGVVVWKVPSFIPIALVITYIYFHYTVVYLRTGRSLRRLEATLRSPIFSGFAELLDGVVTVRAFSVEGRFFDKLCSQVDQAFSAHYFYWMTNRWLLLRFDILGGLSVFLTTVLVVRDPSSSNGDAGMAITFAQGFVMSCYWLSRFWGELEMSMNSVERVEEYLAVPQEPAAVIAGHRPPAYWPSYSTNEAFIRAEELEIKYAPDLPTVFKGSFEIKAGEKIGLIGRTGSGKSTLAMALLRFTDPASGKLILDGIDVTSIGVDDLRSRITYIPQDAVLFSGTVRDNLDPFNEHTDADLLDALARVRLITNDGTPARSGVATPVVSATLQPAHPRLLAVAAEHAAEGSRLGNTTPRVRITLDSEVSAGGSNFSQGQRQLVAMARALLRRSNLIIMDEATASVDFATDEAIQTAIRSEFKESTLLTIAHRLSSVIDYDRLLVLSNGTIAEFDTPMNLLRQETSLFKSLCLKSGKYTELYRAAERKEKGMAAASGAAGAVDASDDA